MRLDERGRTVAVTKHQSKPDGSKVLSHSVTKEPMLAAMRKWGTEKRLADKPLPKARPIERVQRARTRAKPAEPTGNKGLAQTLGALRRARMKLLTDRGAFAGSGTLERPAPLYSDFAAEDYANPGDTADAGSQSRIFNPDYPNFLNRPPDPLEVDPNLWNRRV